MQGNTSTQEYRPRIREIIELGHYHPGKNNAITDVEGVLVGHCTLYAGEGALKPGQGPIRTGVTAILPHNGNLYKEKVTANAFVINGYGKSAGIVQIQELGQIETPILLTNTLNVGKVSDALVSYMIKHNPEIGISGGTVNPVVGECNDGYLNDIQGRHVGEKEVFQAIENAKGGPVEEGAIGAGMGMSCCEFKSGVGTASRLVEIGNHTYTVGILVVSNFGKRCELEIAGVPIGRELRNWQKEATEQLAKRDEDGSIMIILATDAPLSSRQLGRLARRVPLGLAKTGSVVSHGSGDFVIAFSTGHKLAPGNDNFVVQYEGIVENDKTITDFFHCVVEAVEEAVLNSLMRAHTVVGRDNNTSHALPVDTVKDLLKKYGR